LYDQFQKDAKERLVEPFAVFSRDFEKLLEEYS
jgi:hypothetical protein